MTQSDLPQFRQLACNQAFSISKHAYNQMLKRDISYDDVEAILSSNTNQIIECQSPSSTPGKEHCDERILIYDPMYFKAVILVCIIHFYPAPEIRIVTTEIVDEGKWIKKDGANPCLVRK
jgi:hypothetical protein